MIKRVVGFFLFFSILFMQNSEAKQRCWITDLTVKQTIESLSSKYPAENRFRIERGVRKCALLWIEQDGTEADFKSFCQNNFKYLPQDIDAVFASFSRNFEIINGHFNLMSLRLREPLDLDRGNYSEMDELFGGYNPGAHWMDDFYTNKIAFVIALNFPSFSLQEKNTLGKNWTRKEWAYSRLGDLFKVRMPSQLILDYSASLNKAEMYIASYNIMAGMLRDNYGNSLFSKDAKFLSHWNLRDEIKANYSDRDKGLDKQRILSQVMQRIVEQSIPECVINNPQYNWNPYTNEVFLLNKKIDFKEENNNRYSVMLSLFHQLKRQDACYDTSLNTVLKRNFESEMEMPLEDVEDLFVNFLTSPQVKKVSGEIRKRLNRKLEPFDIWYDGFKPRSVLVQDNLTSITSGKYPDANTLQKDLLEILRTLGFSPTKASYLSDKIAVDAARGSGHAAGALMRGDKAHLRTRIAASGMDYKGYNIAIHEFGHNVEQTLSLYDVDYYLLNGVPNTAFTEALAFMFQSRDLELLGIKSRTTETNKLIVLDNFWSLYEIIGVSLVDIRVWKWLYAHPDATSTELREAVLCISRDVWNCYYAPVFGKKDQLLLGIYSHMISYPLYLSAYSFGHLIQFQLENQIAGRNFGEEVERMFTIGRVTPDNWMLKSTGKRLSIEPVLTAVDEVLKIK